MKICLIILSLLALAQPSQAGNFSAFQKILDSGVTENHRDDGGYETWFDYTKIQSSPEMQIQVKKQLETLKNFDITQLKDKNTANAFWINCYNFFMIQTILSQGFKDNKLNISSVKDFGSFFNPYKIFKEKLHNVGGKLYSLDDIEKGILLGADFDEKKWKDARIHFAVNCASVGCPPLIKKVYQAKTLDDVLDDNVKRAMQTARHLRLEGDNLYLTHLFKWYQTDFEKDAGTVKEFIIKYLSDQEKINKIESIDKIKFIPYDWKLNQESHFQAK
jgi:hypothetical protein